MLYRHKPKWLSKTARFDKNGRIEVAWLAQAPHAFTNLRGFRGEHDLLSSLRRSKGYSVFLSDMYGETEFLEWLTEDERMSATSGALRELQPLRPSSK